MFSFFKKSEMVSPVTALKGREISLQTSEKHYVLGTSLKAPFPEGLEQAVFGLGCFWGAEKAFWNLKGVYTTAVGYAAGFTPNPTYEEVCSGLTGHNEVVLVVYNPQEISYETLVKTFFESHNPTQGMRQGNDTGTQYRSGIYTFSNEQQATALGAKTLFEKELAKAGFDAITTEVISATEFYYAEGYHQQYLAKNPNGYCGLGGTGVSCNLS